MWTKTNSPYNLTGNILINSGTTVTVEAGTTLNLNGYYIIVNGSLIIQQGATINMQNAHIQVNGVLSAIGRNNNPIQIKSYNSSIIFSSLSSGWNQQIASGCKIENANLGLMSISVSSSAELTNDTILGGFYVYGGSPVITGNVIGGGISVSGGSPIISENTIHSSINWHGSGELRTEMGQTALIADNIIYDVPPGYPGITLSGYSLDSNLIIERNLITTGIYPGNDGIDIAMNENVNCPVSIINNTIVNNDIGIHITRGVPQSISNNNIYNNTFNVKSGESNLIDCSNNWWGTTDQQAINQTIYDNKNDFNLGTVNFVPFLKAPTSQTTPSLSTSPTSTPSTPEFPSIIIVTIALMTIPLVMAVIKKKSKYANKKVDKQASFQ